jgi:hypothetical protein
VARVIVTPQARRDVDEAISALGLPDNTWARIARSLRPLEAFPLAGPELGGRYEQSSDRVHVVAMHDGRSATSASATRSTYST